MKSKNIGFRCGSFDGRTGKDYTHRINNIHIDDQNMVNITVQKGNEVDVLRLPVEYCEEIGFINFNALLGYVK